MKKKEQREEVLICENCGCEFHGELLEEVCVVCDGKGVDIDGEDCRFCGGSGEGICCSDDLCPDCQENDFEEENYDCYELITR